jgi:hypothetical protein
MNHDESMGTKGHGKGHFSEDSAVFSPTMIQLLRKTRPWLQLVSVAGFIVCAFTLFEGVWAIVGTSVESQIVADPNIPLVLYFLWAVVYFFPSLFLHRYAKAIKRIEVEQGFETMEDAFRHQRAFWRLAGVIVITLVCVLLLGFIFG